MRLTLLYLTSIIAGFCMMALELLGGRFLAPGFGSSIHVWAALISVFILSLSIGYWVGGKWADRITSSRPLGYIILAAAALYFLLPTYALPLANVIRESMGEERLPIYICAMALFLFPSMLLGFVSPMLVRLVFVDEKQVGSTTGTLYAVGSIGNVLGILVTDYILLVHFDLNHTTWGLGAALALVGLLHIALGMPTIKTDTAKVTA